MWELEGWDERGEAPLEDERGEVPLEDERGEAPLDEDLKADFEGDRDSSGLLFEELLPFLRAWAGGVGGGGRLIGSSRSIESSPSLISSEAPFSRTTLLTSSSS